MPPPTRPFLLPHTHPLLPLRPLRPHHTAAAAPPPRRLRPWLYAALFLALGAGAGQLARLAVLPPAPPAPGSALDAALLARLDAEADALAPVRALRRAAPEWRELGRGRGGAGAEGGGEGGGPGAGAGAGAEDGGSEGEAEAEAGLLTGLSVAGARGLGVQRWFFAPARRELVGAVWFGGGAAGWPGVAHGGAIATVVEDGARRCAGAVEGARGLDDTAEPASLSLTYLKPTLANRFYVFRAKYDDSGVAAPLVHPSDASSPPSSSPSSPPSSSPFTDPFPSSISASPSASTAASSPTTTTTDTATDARSAAEQAARHLPPTKDLTKQVWAVGSGSVVLGDTVAVAVDCTVETLEGAVCVKGRAGWRGDRIVRG